ncbi:hypothetical protein FDP41_011027 [Naegleria fowleri]|uniref:BTB domain-containing protein n=1 Tax=Naegleria fowleri TaxID=5763 RepID=A0A6A5CCQ9_NAEFO|nr:uncharacterized protein FDP41_011027 [Naegleria fowleri]KAF0983049.1 hypothetical protein FDP41_011027 [Naegleria fowleri]
MFKSIKFFHSQHVADDCFDKEESYPDAMVEIWPLAFHNKNHNVTTTPNSTSSLSDNTTNSSDYQKNYFLVHRMILSAKNQVLRHLFQLQNNSLVTNNITTTPPHVTGPRSQHHHHHSSIKAKIQLGLSCSEIPIPLIHQKECIQSLLSFYYTGRLELNRREHVSSLLLLAHIYFAPEIVLSLVHYLNCTLLKTVQDFTLSDCLNILSLFHMTSQTPCQNTIISSMDSWYENAILQHHEQLQQTDYTCLFSKHLAQHQNTYQPFTFKEWSSSTNSSHSSSISDSSTNSSHPSFIDKYGGSNDMHPLWKKHVQELREKALQSLTFNFSSLCARSEFLNLSFERMQSMILQVIATTRNTTRNITTNTTRNTNTNTCQNHENHHDLTLPTCSQFLQVIIHWLHFDDEHRIMQARSLFSLLQVISHAFIEKKKKNGHEHSSNLFKDDPYVSGVSFSSDLNTPSSSSSINTTKTPSPICDTVVHIPSATSLPSQSHQQSITSFSPTRTTSTTSPEIQTTSLIQSNKSKMSSFLGIDMEETNSTSTPPTSPVVSIPNMTNSSQNSSTLNSPQVMTSDVTFGANSISIPSISTTNLNSVTLSTKTPMERDSKNTLTTQLHSQIGSSYSNSHNYSLTPNMVNSGNPSTTSRMPRSHSAFVRPQSEQEKGTFGHLKRLATPFKFTFTERDDEREPPKTIFEVEEESLSDWQQVGKMVTIVPVKRTEQVLVKREENMEKK